MIEGTVNPAFEATIPLRLYGDNGRTVDISAVVDTGFTGFLTLPSPLIAELELPFSHYGHAFLADDTELEYEVYNITVSWDGRSKAIDANATGSTPLVGMRLLDDHDLNIQVRIGGRVLIQPIPE